MNHYHTNFHLHRVHHYGLTELDNMIPFERQVYLALIEQRLQEEQRQSQMGGVPPLIGEGI